MLIEWLMTYLGVSQVVAQLLIATVAIGIVLIIIALADGGLLCCGIAGIMLMFFFTFISYIPVWVSIIVGLFVSALVAKQLAGGSGGGEGD